MSNSPLNPLESLNMDDNDGLGEGIVGGLAKDPLTSRKEKVDLENKRKNRFC